VSGIDTAVDPREPAPWNAAAPPRRPVVFGIAFATLLALLVIRNRALFTVVVDESGDPAANSIITAQAKHFALLVGNYSRLGFSHPGPGFFYVQAFGEWLFHDRLRIVPAPWNGQVLGVLVLNAALLAATMTVLAGWLRSWPATALAGAAALGFLARHGQAASVMWPPFMYVLPFLLLLVAAASVAAGRTADLWALALAAGLLVHGHAQFLLFVPVITAAALVALVARRRAGVWQRPRDWLVGLAVAAVFALPMVVNLALHWPGEFPKYLGYGSSEQAGGHPVAAATGYVAQFWPGGPLCVVVGVVLLAAVAIATRRREAGAFVTTGAAFVGLGLVMMTGYAATGIDDLGQRYVGYFSWAIPLLLGALVAGCAGGLLPGRLARPVAVAGLAVALVAALAAPTLVTTREPLPGAPLAVAALADRANGRPVVLALEGDTWPQMVGLLVAGQRRGVRICVDVSWRFMVTDQYVCTARERASGMAVTLVAARSAAPGRAVIAPVGSALLTA
jgi:hypothetical protein